MEVAPVLPSRCRAEKLANELGRRVEIRESGEVNG